MSFYINTGDYATAKNCAPTYLKRQSPLCLKTQLLKRIKPPQKNAVAFISALGMRNHLAVKVRYRLGSRNC